MTIIIIKRTRYDENKIETFPISIRLRRKQLHEYKIPLASKINSKRNLHTFNYNFNISPFFLQILPVTLEMPTLHVKLRLVDTVLQPLAVHYYYTVCTCSPEVSRTFLPFFYSHRCEAIFVVGGERE